MLETPPARLGRPPGSTNKATQELRRLIEEAAAEHMGLPGSPEVPLEPLPVTMTRLGFRYLKKGEEGDAGALQVGAKLLTSAADFAYPRLKAIEHSGQIETQVPIIPFPGERPAPVV